MFQTATSLKLECLREVNRKTGQSASQHSFLAASVVFLLAFARYLCRGFPLEYVGSGLVVVGFKIISRLDRPPTHFLLMETTFLSDHFFSSPSSDFATIAITMSVSNVFTKYEPGAAALTIEE